MSSLKWVPKALAQKAISKLGLLPLYHYTQQRGGRLKHFHPLARAEYAAKMYADTAPYVSIQGAALVEIGTGWVPVVPLLLHLMGAGRIITIDLNRHLQPALTLRIVPLMAECFAEINRRCGFDIGVMRERLMPLLRATTVNDLFELAGIEYRAPDDASNSGLSLGTIDVVYSNLVLEHVTPAALCSIHTEAARILKPTGVCWHNIDYSDHYAATHSGLSPINMLRYPEWLWNLVGQNDILYQNRLRRSQHVELFEQAGLTPVAYVDHEADGVARTLAAGFPLAATYCNLRAKDLLITSSRFVLSACEVTADKFKQTREMVHKM